MSESYNEADFEYDAEGEAADEGADEAMDEGADEYYAEAGDEGADEAMDEGADEYYAEAGDEGADEAMDEAVDEGIDEAVDEALDEATVSASARLRADRDRNRRVSWARRIAADQRLEAQRAASAQRSIATQARAVQPGGPARVASVGALQGSGVVTAVLPNGRRSQMRIVPTLAPVKEVNRLRTVLLSNERRQAVATARNSRAIKALATTHVAGMKKLAALQVKSDKDISKRLVEAHNRLDSRITKELGSGAGSMGKHGKRMLAMLRRQRQRSIMNSVTIASSLPFWAAYGKRSDPFATNNLILGGSLLGWLVGDELIDQFSGKSGVAKTGANWWSWLAPIGNGATVHFLLKDKQHERYIAGISTIAAGQASVLVKLENLIGEDSFEDFKKDTPHSVVATLVTGTTGDIDPVAATTVNANLSIASASIAQGTDELTITLTGAALAAVKVAWIVDTETSETLEKATT
jgi:hypothetical protein